MTKKAHSSDLEIEELKEELLHKVAGGEYDASDIEFVAGKIENLINMLSQTPITSQLDPCIEASESLKKSKESLLLNDIQNAYYGSTNALSIILKAYETMPEHSFVLDNIQSRLSSIITSILDLID